VSRRLWAEPQVRGWLLFTVVLLLGSVFLAARSISEWREETRVVRSGLVVQAVAWHSGGAKVKGMSLASGSLVDIEYKHEGKTYKATGQLHRTGQEYVSLEPFDIRIDPQSPEDWTNRTDAPPVIEKMMGAMITALVAAICAVITLVLRGLWGALWVHGEQVTARVIGQGQSALAPQSAALRCALRSGKTERLVTVYVPQNAAPADGAQGKQTIELITSADRSRALALINYNS
jgi:hypothetical protein